MAVWARPKDWEVEAVVVSDNQAGADQVAVWTRPDGWAVDAILPFPRDSYRKDFLQSAADDGRNVQADFDAALRKPIPSWSCRKLRTLKNGFGAMRV